MAASIPESRQVIWQGDCGDVNKFDKKERSILLNELNNAIEAEKVKDNDAVLGAYASNSGFGPFCRLNWLLEAPHNFMIFAYWTGSVS
jgi:hypothetical protein